METRSNHVLVGAVVLILLAVLALFTIWLARLGSAQEKQYDIFFKQSVDGLAKGSPVAYSGVPSGQVKEIQLWKPDPQYVRVRVNIAADTPILQGTTATIQSSFTGTSTIQLDGGVKGAPPIGCPDVNPERECPYGVPVIPTQQGGLGAILSSAPQLLARLSTASGRFSTLLGDKNRASIAGVLGQTKRLADAFAHHRRETVATLAQIRIAIKQAGDAAQKIGNFAGTTRALSSDLKPTIANLNEAIKSSKQATDALDATAQEVRGGPHLDLRPFLSRASFRSTTARAAAK